MLKYLELKKWKQKKFPQKLCTQPHQEEEGVLVARKYFACALIDERFKDSLRILLLKPYTCVSEGETLFGWVDSDGNVYDHKDHGVDNGNEVVVAWRKA
jgi:hypothetical protein